MLVIARRKGQRIFIGHDVEVVVTDISRQSVKLAFRAPASVTILRGEIREAIEEANRQAALTHITDASELSRPGASCSGGAEDDEDLPMLGSESRPSWGRCT